jgi:hypothetical protein
VIIFSVTTWIIALFIDDFAALITIDAITYPLLIISSDTFAIFDKFSNNLKLLPSLSINRYYCCARKFKFLNYTI